MKSFVLKTFIIPAFISVSTIYSLDQIILKNGKVRVGSILEVNRHFIEIEYLENLGTEKFKRIEILKWEREGKVFSDIPEVQKNPAEFKSQKDYKFFAGRSSDNFRLIAFIGTPISYPLPMPTFSLAGHVNITKYISFGPKLGASTGYIFPALLTTATFLFQAGLQVTFRVSEKFYLDLTQEIRFLNYQGKTWFAEDKEELYPRDIASFNYKSREYLWGISAGYYITRKLSIEAGFNFTLMRQNFQNFTFDKMFMNNKKAVELFKKETHSANDMFDFLLDFYKIRLGIRIDI